MKMQLIVLSIALISAAVASHPSSHSLVPQSTRFTKRDNTTTATSLYKLSSDAEFHYELLRNLGLAPYGGSDIAEVLIAANQLIPGSFESYYSAFNSLANRVYDSAKAIDPVKYPISARDTNFRAATYFRAADFFLHGNWTDPRINSLWAQALDAFNSAAELLPVPAQRVNITAVNFTVPAIFYSCGLPGPRPVLIIGNGYDGAQEESYHQFVVATLQRGFHAITYEGPGQPTVRRYQNLGFIPDWERVVSPVVDYLLTRGDVDSASIGLLGFSFGGYLAPRAAAFEHRLAAVMAVDGLYDFGGLLYGSLSRVPNLINAIKAGNSTVVNGLIKAVLSIVNENTTATRWVIQQGMWAFNTPTPYEWLVKVPAFSLAGVAGNITTPTFVGDAEVDEFSAGQGKLLADAIGAKATYHLFKAVDGVGIARPTGGQVLQNQVVLDWFESVIANKTGCTSRRES